MTRIRRLLCRILGCCKPTIQGEFMYIVRNSQPDVPFHINAVALDEEGEQVPDERLLFQVQSSDSDVVSVALGSDGVSGVAHFGRSGTASIVVSVSARSTGEILGSFGAQFTVTTGDPAAISGGTIVFEGLTES